jgi:hypothetical protein
VTLVSVPASFSSEGVLSCGRWIDACLLAAFHIMKTGDNESTAVRVALLAGYFSLFFPGRVVGWFPQRLIAVRPGRFPVSTSIRRVLFLPAGMACTVLFEPALGRVIEKSYVFEGSGLTPGGAGCCGLHQHVVRLWFGSRSGAQGTRSGSVPPFPRDRVAIADESAGSHGGIVGKCYPLLQVPDLRRPVPGGGACIPSVPTHRYAVDGNGVADQRAHLALCFKVPQLQLEVVRGELAHREGF